MLKAQRRQNSKGDALEGAQEKLKGGSLIEETTLELPRSVIRWLRCLAERENASLESVLERRVIDMVAADLDNLAIVAEVLGYDRIVDMGLERDLTSLGYDLPWLAKRRESDRSRPKRSR